MLLSMTGYGRATQSFQDKTIVVEIRSLNSKFTDVRLKVPQNYREKEPDIRRILSERLERGKIDFTLDVQSLQGDESSAINTVLFRKYYIQLSRIIQDLGMPPGDLTQAILRLPNVVAGPTEQVDEEEWTIVETTIQNCIRQFEDFRATEGQVIKTDLTQRIQIILENLAQITPFEEDRIPKLRQRIHQNLEEYLGKEKIDENRFEQEILFYLEKMDITEEKVRLGQHCNYFLEELAKDYTQKGRKLSFISQEIGREINTLGAKAYSSEIQRLVVIMKDELEKIKEQVANCL